MFRSRQSILYSRGTLEGLFYTRLGEALARDPRNSISRLDADYEAARIIRETWDDAQFNTAYWRKLGAAVETGGGTLATTILLADLAATGGALTAAWKAGAAALVMTGGLRRSLGRSFSLSHKKAVFENARADLAALCESSEAAQESQGSIQRPRRLTEALGRVPPTGESPRF